MLLSMTGYGKSEAVYQNKKIVVEIRSLNSKNIDINTRIASQYFSKDLEIRQLIVKELVRGKVDLSIKVEETGCINAAIINKDAVESYVAQIKETSAQIGINEPQDWWAVICKMPGVTQCSSTTEINDEELEVVLNATKEAISNLITFRRQEGEAVTLKFTEKLDNIAARLKEVDQYETARTEKIRQQIVSKLETLPLEYDSNRLEQEMIYYIEKLDINEEKQRLANHLQYFADTMNSNEAQGKKLGFIAQEMGREINTLGSKSNQAEMQNLVVMMKESRRPSGLRKTRIWFNSLAHRTTWLRSDLNSVS